MSLTLATVLLCVQQAMGAISFTEFIPTCIQPALVVQRTAAPGNWKWTLIELWDQNNDGKLDLWIGKHTGGGGGILLRQGATLNDWTNETANLGLAFSTLPATNATPGENKPLIFDFDNDGDDDIGATGNENSVKSLRNDITTLTPIRPADANFHGLTFQWRRVADLNLDGWMDAETYQREYGVTHHWKAINDGDGTFTISSDVVPIPADLPAAVQVELAALAGQMVTGNQYCGPRYWRGDLDADGDEDCIVQYGGSYSGTAFRFGRYLIRDADGALKDKTATIGLPGHLLPMITDIRDYNGDGRLDIFLAYGEKSEAGLYRQNADGTFTRRVVDTLLGRDASADPWTSFYDPGNYMPAVVHIDFDRDGDFDVLVQQPMMTRVTVYECGADGDLRAVQRAAANGAEGVCWGDIDSDGDQDFAVVFDTNGPVKFYLNNADPAPPSNLPPTVNAGGDKMVQIPADAAALDGTVNEVIPTDHGVKYIADPPVERLFLPVPPHDINSAAWQSFKKLVDRSLAGNVYAINSYEHAVVYAVTGDERHRAKAIALADAVVTAAEERIAAGLAPAVAGDQYLAVGRTLKPLAAAYAWCDPPPEMKARWKFFAEQTLHNTWNRTDIIWGDKKFPPGAGYALGSQVSNYKHSFVVGTMYWALATGDDKWLDFLKIGLADPNHANNVFAGLTKIEGGGSPEGTGYGESQRTVFELALLWQEATGAQNVLGDFPRHSISYWTHATLPDFSGVCPIGDQARAAKLDDYKRHLMRSALDLVPADCPEAATARWWMRNCKIPPTRYNEFSDFTGPESPPPTLVYHATGVGQLFDRTSWQSDAVLVWLIAGPQGTDHAHKAHGAFGVYHNEFKTVTQSWWAGGLLQHTPYHNVLRFEKDGVVIKQNVKGAVSILKYIDAPDRLTAEMDLTPAYTSGVKKWIRTIKWIKPDRFEVGDSWEVDHGVRVYQQLQTPQPDSVTVAEPIGVFESWKVINPAHVSPGHRGGYRLNVEDAKRLVFKLNI